MEGRFILRGRFGPVCQRRPTVETSSPCSLICHHFRGSFILRGRFGPVHQRRPIVETSSNFTFSTPTTFNSIAPPSSHSTSTGTQTHESLPSHFSYKVFSSTGTRTHDSPFQTCSLTHDTTTTTENIAGNSAIYM